MFKAKTLDDYIDDISAECRNFLDIADYAKENSSEHMLKLSIIGHNLTAKFEQFEHERIKGKLSG